MSTFVTFVMDPMERVNPAHDTSFAFMLAAQARGFRVLHVAPKDIDLEPHQLTFRGLEIKGRGSSDRFLRSGHRVRSG